MVRPAQAALAIVRLLYWKKGWRPMARFDSRLLEATVAIGILAAASATLTACGRKGNLEAPPPSAAAIERPPQAPATPGRPPLHPRPAALTGLTP